MVRAKQVSSECWALYDCTGCGPIKWSSLQSPITVVGKKFYWYCTMRALQNLPWKGRELAFIELGILPPAYLTQSFQQFSEGYWDS